MARKWNTDTFTFCVVKRNMRDHFLSPAIPLNILTRQQKKQWYGRWILLWFLSCGAPTCTCKEKVMSSKACFGSFLVSKNAGAGDHRFFFLFFFFTSLHFDRSPQRRLGVGEIKPVAVHRGGCRVFGNGTDELGDQVEWRKSKQTIGQEGTQTDEAAGGSACMQTVRDGDRRTDRRM